MSCSEVPLSVLLLVLPFPPCEAMDGFLDNGGGPRRVGPNTIDKLDAVIWLMCCHFVTLRKRN